MHHSEQDNKSAEQTLLYLRGGLQSAPGSLCLFMMQTNGFLNLKRLLFKNHTIEIRSSSLHRGKQAGYVITLFVRVPRAL